MGPPHSKEKPLAGSRMNRSINFSAGPAALPLAVLERVQDELLDYRGLGHSIMETSHRSPEFMELADRSKRNLRAIYGLNDDFEVLFLQGGATLQFAMIPMNFPDGGRPAGYVDTGVWASKAISEARCIREVDVLASGASACSDIVSWGNCEGRPYVHITANETVNGVQFPELPSMGDTPVCADISSEFLTRPLDVNSASLAYAGAQKNAGPAGVTIVIVHREVIDAMSGELPSMLSYRRHARAGSMLNTPATFSWYVAGLVFEWVLAEGGVAEMERRTEVKSRLLYHVLDQSDLYLNTVPSECRSRVNVPFWLGSETMDQKFLEAAEGRGLRNLKGHQRVGGIRASLYNAVSESDVRQLVEFMQDFERTA